jgi:hypothetical protein
MRWTSRQHLQMAQHLDAKARLATGEKRARLASLAAAARLVAGLALEQESARPRIAEVLLKPSFEAETSLRVIAEPDHTIVELTSAESIVSPQFTKKSVVASNCASRFWTKLDELLAAPFDFEHNIGFDGITIKVDCRTPAGQKHFEVWSPKPTSHAGMLIGLIYDIAQEASTAPAAIRCLEGLRGHLRDGY